MSKIQFQTRYNRSAKPVISTGEGMTEQSHKNECDMNYILRDYARTGLIKHAKENQGRYDDVSPIDFQQAMFTCANVKNLFEELPASIRKRFNNNPEGFLSYVQEPSNAPEMKRLGILRGNDGIDISGAPTRAPVGAGEVPSPVNAGETSTEGGTPA